MTDTTQPAAAPVTPETPASAVAAPVLPVVVEPAQAAAAPPPSPAAAAALPDPVAAPKAASAHDTPTLLEEQTPKPAEAKPEAKPAAAEADEVGKETVTPAAEAKPGEPTKPAEATEAKPAEPVKPESVEYKYTVPESIKLDDATKTELHTALDDFRANPAEGSQKLMDLHARAMERYAQETLASQHQAFADTRKGWRTEVMADPEIGGAGHQTAMGAIARVRDKLISSARQDTPQYQADLAAFNNMLRITGAGDHPAFLKMLHNGARFFDEAPQPAPNPRNGPKLQKENSRPPGGFKEVMYDHPRSVANGS